MNSTFEPFDAAIPGTFPKLNLNGLRLALRAAISLNCSISDTLEFDRKHYDYHDLPAGYQITQYRKPLATKGWVEISQGRQIGIKQIHLEQDSAKSIYLDTDNILVDLNRAGAGLIEIVSEPDIESASEAASLVSKIHDLLQDTQVCSGLLEQGVMRIDVNVNWIDSDTKAKLTPRVELKNVNGIKIIEDAVTVELERQKHSPASELSEETRLFLPNTQETVLLRKKDGSRLYRYLPEYDLKPITVSAELIEQVRDSMPKTRHQLIGELCKEHPQLNPESLLRLWSHPILPTLFDASINISNLSPEFVLNWLVGDMLGVLNKYPGVSVKISTSNCAQLLQLLQGSLTDKTQAKSIVFEAIQGGTDLLLPEPQLEAQAVDLAAEIEVLFKDFSDRVKYLQNQPNLRKGALDFFIGRILKKHRGKVTVEDITQQLLRNLNNKPVA